MDVESSKNTTETETIPDASAQTAAEPWLFRYQFFLRSQDQRAVAFLLVIAFLGAIFAFAYKAHIERGFVDIDRAESRSAQYLVDINSAE